MSDHVLLGLERLDVSVFRPLSKREMNLAGAFEDFANFVFFVEPEKCEALIHRAVERNGSAGVLQGGNDDYDIYRLVIVDDDDDGSTTEYNTSSAAGNELLRLFLESSTGRQHRNVLTVPNIKHYMLAMCSRRSDGIYSKLGNLMFVLSFGPVDGQVRHIDSTGCNLQICTYMSKDCPSTTVFSTVSKDDTLSHIFCAGDLLRFWSEEEHLDVPSLVGKTLSMHGDVPLQARPYTKYFKSWKSINFNLAAFGKLYCPVRERLEIQTTMPGDTMVLPNNQVHAGPSSFIPRMFAFAVGIPDDAVNELVPPSEEGVELCVSRDSEDGDGELQYNPVLLHLDLCCILFAFLDFESDSPKDEVRHAKIFLMVYLVRLIKDGGEFYGQRRADVYDPMFNEDRAELRDWLRSLVRVCLEFDDANQHHMLNSVVDSTVFHTPDMPRVNRKRQKRSRRALKAAS